MTQRDEPAAARADLEAWRESVWRERFDGDVFFHGLLRHHLGDASGNAEQRLKRVARETGLAPDDVKKTWTAAVEAANRPAPSEKNLVRHARALGRLQKETA